MALKVSRPGRAATTTLLLLCVAVVAVYAWAAARNYQAYRESTRRTQSGLERAISLEPKRAAFHNLLGRDLSFQTQNPSTAIAHLKQAVELNPYESSYWLDLAQAYYAVGANSDVKQAIGKAIAVDPTTPRVVWDTGNFLLLDGNVPGAMQQFSVVLRHSPERIAAVLNTAWQATHDVSAIEAILPDNPETHLQFLKLLIDENDAKSANNVWSHLWQLNEPFDFRTALFYIDYLIKQRDITAAVEVWKQLASKSPELAKYSGKENKVANGAFAEGILNAGFGWHYVAQPGAEVSLDANNPHATNRSVMISFTGAVADAGLFEYVPVQPNTWYTLSAWVKSENLLTANGPILVAGDPDKPEVRGVTDETSGTTDWHQLHTSFQTGNSSRLLRVNVAREPASTQIQGRFWLTEIAIQEASTSPGK
jgi:cytochrome c-type biogenesis protein CcmH/NrfG